MTAIERSVEDGELLLEYALRNKIDVPKALHDTLRGARTQLEALETAGAARDGFYAALAQIVTLVPVKVVEIRTSMERTLRLKPQVVDAQKLMSYAAANGKAIDDEVRNGVIEVGNAVDQGTPAVADEEKFFKNYQALATKLAPVTAATLAASETRFPNWFEFLRNPREFLRKASHMTVGRFVHFLIFVLVLIVAGLGLAYQGVGEIAMTRYDDLYKKITDLQKRILTETGAVQDKEGAWLLANAKDARSDTAQQARKAFKDAVRDLESDQALLDQYVKEQGALPAALLEWEKKPCDSAWTSWMCAFLEKSLSGPQTASPSAMQIVFSARAALARMNQIMLPLLLGLLGAYSWVLRSMSVEIRERSFAPHSSLQHLVRLSLGALAGIASGWLLKPEQVGLLASVPAWTLAFVAGYGTELVFAFMDRIIAAFTAKS